MATPAAADPTTPTSEEQSAETPVASFGSSGPEPTAPVLAAATSQAPESLVFVIDTSGSMAGTPLVQAKDALGQGIDVLAPEQAAGLRSYGGVCSDGGDLLVPVATGNHDELRLAVDGLTASGGTPTPEALRAAVADLPPGGSRTIVLISDGESTCGDPCPVAEELVASSNVSFTVQTVGFNPAGDAPEELRCIADVTGGNYVEVTDTEGLAEAIQGAVSGPPEPPPDEGVLVGLGDSVAAGYGLGPSNGYRSANGEPGGNNSLSYPHVLASELGLESYNFAIAGACAATPGKDGAHPRTPVGTQEYPRCTKSILTDQLERLRQTGIMPTIVTITVGGNDIDFSECFGSALGLSEAEPCKGSAFNDRLAALHANLSKVLGILERRYPDTRVIVTEYFNPLPPEPQPLEDSCALSHFALLAQDSQRYANLLRKDAFLLLDEVATLQGELHLTAAEIVGSLNRALGATADLYEADVVSLDFTGHDVCRGYSATEIRYYGFLTGNGRIEVPAQTGEAWVFAPSVRAFALVENRFISVFIDLRLSPIERCRVTCNEVEVIREPPFTAIIRANGFPHPTAAGQEAIADRIRFASGL